jgi:hypothetical protein
MEISSEAAIGGLLLRRFAITVRDVLKSGAGRYSAILDRRP